MSTADAARLAAWNASDEGKAAWVAAEDAEGAARAAAEAACDAAERAWDTAEGNARDARIAYCAARAAYLAKTTTPETP